MKIYVCVNESIPLCFAFPGPSFSGTTKVEILFGVLSSVFQKHFSHLYQEDIHLSPWAEKSIAISAMYQPCAPLHTDHTSDVAGKDHG